MSKPTGTNPELIAEAQEIVDALNRDLIAAENESKQGEIDPSRVNNLFRSAHTLKGIAGMFGFDLMSRLAHELEAVLDGMRLGRVQADANALDGLFACVEIFGELIAAASLSEPGDSAKVDALIQRLSRVASGSDGGKEQDVLDAIDLGEDVLSVLTEYEEHRLRENVRKGRNLYMLRTAFELSNFDVGLAEIDEAVRKAGEVITKLPSSKAADPTSISFDILVGSDKDAAELDRIIGDDRVEVVVVGRRDAARPAPPPVPSAPEPIQDVEPAADAPEAPSMEESGTVRSVSQTVRVDIARLDRLMNLVGELALTRAAFQRITDVIRRERGFTAMAAELHKEGRNFERRLGELQAGMMEVRMVPLANLFERMVRMGRKVSRELNREVRIEVAGENTELDKLIVEDLADPLMHLIRNAIDHGIESPEERLRAGKEREGVVRLSAAAHGNHVVVQVSDDGRGIDVKRTLEMAIKVGLVAPERAAELSRREIFNLLFLPGFSTREEVSEYSGRGVGLDVVKTNVSKISGVIDVESGEGQGTLVTVTLPITLAIIPALIVSAAGRTYAIPLNNVQETLAIDKSTIKTIERREIISVRGSTVPLVDLRRVFQLSGKDRPETFFGVVAGLAVSRMALVVDELVGQQDIVIKSLGHRLRRVRGIAGAAELGNQQTILVIDIVELLNEMSALEAVEAR